MRNLIVTLAALSFTLMPLVLPSIMIERRNRRNPVKQTRHHLHPHRIVKRTVSRPTAEAVAAATAFLDQAPVPPKVVAFACTECGMDPSYVPIGQTVVSFEDMPIRGQYVVKAVCRLCDAPLVSAILSGPEAFALTEAGAVLEADLLKPFRTVLEDDVEHPVDAVYRTAVDPEKVHP